VQRLFNNTAPCGHGSVGPALAHFVGVEQFATLSFGARRETASSGRGHAQFAYCYYNAVSNIEFAWDRRKARSNLAKHRVSFEEGQSVFLDESARLIDDPDHSDDGDRFLLLGYSFQARLFTGQSLLPSVRFRNPAYFRRRATPQEEEVYGDSNEKRIRFF
jgi:uncharacterized DUF497 family protein